MDRAKTQLELVTNFVLHGGASGQQGSLIIIGDTLYNTENNEFLPVARRYGDPDDKIFGLNFYGNWQGHSNIRRHVEYVELEIQEYNQLHPGAGEIDFYNISFDVMHDPVSKAVAERGSLVVINKNISNGIKQNGDNKEITPAQKRGMETYRILKNELNRIESEDRKSQFGALADIPYIMEKAIANGGIDPEVLQNILKTRDDVKGIMDKLDNYLSIMMTIPTEDK